MGFPKDELGYMFGEFLRDAKYRTGENARVDLMISQIKFLIERSDRSYLAGMIEGFTMGEVHGILKRNDAVGIVKIVPPEGGEIK